MSDKNLGKPVKKNRDEKSSQGLPKGSGLLSGISAPGGRGVNAPGGRGVNAPGGRGVNAPGGRGINV